MTISQLQHWMKTVITAQGNLQQQVASAEKLHHLRAEDIVVSDHLPADMRLGIYSGGYLLRLLECLQADFPALCSFMGEQVFGLFAKAYLLSHPSRSYTLFDLGQGFPSFLQETRPQKHQMGSKGDAMLDLPISLARLERARLEAMRSPGTETAAPNAENASWSFWMGPVMLQAPECLRLPVLDFPLMSFYRELAQNRRPEPPAPQRSFTAISRKNYRITMMELEEWQYIFLQACNRPATIPDAATITATACGRQYDAVLADLYLWLPVATDNGLISVHKNEETQRSS